MVSAAPPLLCLDIGGSVKHKVEWMRQMVRGTARELDAKLESNPRLLTCGYGVVFGRLEFVFKRHTGNVPVEQLRSILLMPVRCFDKDNEVRKSTATGRWLPADGGVCVLVHRAGTESSWPLSSYGRTGPRRASTSSASRASRSSRPSTATACGPL